MKVFDVNIGYLYDISLSGFLFVNIIFWIVRYCLIYSKYVKEGSVMWWNFKYCLFYYCDWN